MIKIFNIQSQWVVFARHFFYAHIDSVSGMSDNQRSRGAKLNMQLLMTQKLQNYLSGSEGMPWTLFVHILLILFKFNHRSQYKGFHVHIDGLFMYLYSIDGIRLMLILMLPICKCNKQQYYNFLWRIGKLYHKI